MKLINKKDKRNYTIHSLETYNLAMRLRKERGWGGKRIRKYLEKLGIDISVGSIEGWIYHGKEPFQMKIITQISKDSEELTPEKAYILGTLCGDGYTSTGYRIGLSVCDKEFAEYFKYCLEKVYRVRCSLGERIRKQTNKCLAPEKQYVVSLVSKLVFKDIQRYTESFKSKEWKIPNQIKEATKGIQAAFIRGFADSEGGVRLRKGHSEVTIHSSNKESLKDIQEMLSDTFKIKVTLGVKKSAYYLNLFTYDSLKKYYDEVGFIIKRKQNALKEGLDSYKRKGIRRYPEEFKIKAMNLLKQGLKHRKIAKLLGTNHTNIYDWERALDR